MNIVFTDGRHLIATRCRTNLSDGNPSLFYCIGSGSLSTGTKGANGVVIASEPLTSDEKWTMIPVNSMVSVPYIEGDVTLVTEVNIRPLIVDDITLPLTPKEVSQVVQKVEEGAALFVQEVEQTLATLEVIPDEPVLLAQVLEDSIASQLTLLEHEVEAEQIAMISSPRAAAVAEEIFEEPNEVMRKMAIMDETYMKLAAEIILDSASLLIMPSTLSLEDRVASIGVVSA